EQVLCPSHQEHRATQKISVSEGAAVTAPGKASPGRTLLPNTNKNGLPYFFLITSTRHVCWPVLPVPSPAATVQVIVSPMPPESRIVIVSPAIRTLHDSGLVHVTPVIVTCATPVQTSVAVALNESVPRCGFSGTSLGVIVAGALHEIVGALVSTTRT